MELKELGRALMRRRLRFALLLVGTVGVVMTITFLLTPVYESESSLRVRSDTGGGLSQAMLSGIEDMIPTGIQLPGLGDTDVSTEVGILGSRRIVQGVADSLSLHVELQRPWRAFRTDVLEVIRAGPEAPRGVFTLRHEGEGVYQVTARGTRTEVLLPEMVRIGEAFTVGPMEFRIRADLADEPPPVIRFQVIPFTRMMRGLRQDLRIGRDDAGSRLVTIRYRHPDPELARALVNGILDDFMVYSETVNRSDSGREVEILAEQLEGYTAELRRVEAELQAYQERERLVLPEEQATSQIQRIAELQVLNDALEVERSALSDFLTRIEARPDPVDGVASPYRQLATFPSFLRNAAIQEFLEALIELENARAELLVLRTEENQDVRMVQDRIRQIEGQLRDLTVDYLEGLETQLASSGTALARFGDELERIPQLEIEYTRRMRDRRLLSEVVVMLEARLVQARVREALDDARVRPVDRGIIEDRAAFPRPPISLVLSLFLGVLVGLFGVVATETSNPVIRSPRSAESALGAPVLAAVPAGPRGARLFVRSHPLTAAADSLQALASELRRGPAPGVLLVAGPGRGEGRSTVAANLALAWARQGGRVALVDADLRGGSLHQLFQVSAEPGWLDAASPEAGSRSIDPGAGTGTLHLLPRGPEPGLGGHPLDRLGDPSSEAVLTRLRDDFDVVLVDSPPLGDFPDARLLARLADGVILVAQSDRTSQTALREAAGTLGRIGASVRGLVLNRSSG